MTFLCLPCDSFEGGHFRNSVLRDCLNGISRRRGYRCLAGSPVRALAIPLVLYLSCTTARQALNHCKLALIRQPASPQMTHNVGVVPKPAIHMAAKKPSGRWPLPCAVVESLHGAGRSADDRQGNGGPRGLKLIICPAFTIGSEEETTAMSALLWTWPGIVDSGKACASCEYDPPARPLAVT
jgi:hypothetical protein